MGWFGSQFWSLKTIIRHIAFRPLIRMPCSNNREPYSNHRRLEPQIPIKNTFPKTFVLPTKVSIPSNGATLGTKL